VCNVALTIATDAQLQQAFHELRGPDWPEVFGELAHETLRYRLVRLRAVLIARGVRVEARPQPWLFQPDASTLPRPSAQVKPPDGSPRFAMRQARFDPKRLAAADHDD
jgi:hypothetical protein